MCIRDSDCAFQNEYSNLLDAYKKNELLQESGLGLFMLSSIPVDRAEPSEALKSTSVWAYGLTDTSKILLSDQQLEKFKAGIQVETEIDVRAARGAYYIYSLFELEKGEKRNWGMCAEVNQDSSDIANLNRFLLTQKNLEQPINDDIQTGTNNLIKLVAKADGIQTGNEELGCARHFSNVLYNAMRGGIFTNNYTIDVSDFGLYVQQTNKPVKEQFAQQIAKLPNKISYPELVSWGKESNNADLERICYEYLPLTFSRRHGDPSRPWNQFSIETKNNDGTDKLNYQGNWRDIFQNWEALNVSFPEFIEGITCKFLNASTPDGYNPYRITREGMDWESPEPNDPWAYIGYWGDHQIIYLQKFLEQSNNFHPGKLDELMTKEFFVYANVPYRIKPFEEIVKNPKDTIVFDHHLNDEIKLRAKESGADAKLLRNKNGDIHKTNLTEKILVTLLAKISNFIPEAGIWLNTQRPEWNDANNALVGNGVSMVTLYYIRRFMKFWEGKIKSTSIEKVEISEELKRQFDKTFSLFSENLALLETGFSDTDRFYITSMLGKAGSEYRETIYISGFSGKRSTIQFNTIEQFIQTTLKFIDQSIEKNKRPDGLYHAYNLIAIKGESITIRYLYEMLEGQVAVLSSGYLSTTESLDVLDAMKKSSLFRHDQYSYLLYPNRQLPRFTEKNNIPKEKVIQSELLQTLIADNNKSVITKDLEGNFHFNGTLRNSAELAEALNSLNPVKYGLLAEQEKTLILNIFEDVFDHQSFTGRSGTFFGYEGLGSIYWHMVSKLLLAAQECYFKGIKENAGVEILNKIKAHYYEIKAGIGLYKSPELYGAFPTDAYSHTPANSGVKQPGLTGQVKEDVISRFGELGIHIQNGRIVFNPSLLNRNEILTQKSALNYIDLTGNKKSIGLNEQQLGFTYCQVPVILSFGHDEKLILVLSNGETKEFSSHKIEPEYSSKIFARTGEVERVEFLAKK
jgi:hypothetical protein